MQPVVGDTVCAELVDGVLLCVHARVPPSAGDWARYCEYAGSVRDRDGRLRTLAVAAGIVAGPNAHQRAEYARKVSSEDSLVALLCSGLAARAAMVAMAWFNPNMRAFADDEVHAALIWLGVPISPAIRASITRMRAHVEGAERRRRSGAA
jgi:hypothetical protein